MSTRTSHSFSARIALASLLSAAALAITPAQAKAKAEPTASSQKPSIKPGKAYVRVLSYNVKGLPSIINSYKKSRFPVIGEMLAERRKKGTAPDIVLLQEAFINPTLDIYKESGYPYLHKGPNAKGTTLEGKTFNKLLNGGLYILSEYPFKKSARINFPSNSCKTFDCYANKGSQFVTVRVPKIPFDLQILNTHTQSGSKHEAIRENQFQWLNYFLRVNVNYNDPYRATLFGGDFNARPDSRASFRYFEDLTEMTPSGEACLAPQSKCTIKKGTETAWIHDKSLDHIFFASGKKVRIRPVSVERNFAEMHKGKVLSDHLGYEVLFEVTWQ